MKNTAIKNPESHGKVDDKASVEKPFYNCHTHIFNFEHVHAGFLKRMIPWKVGLILVLTATILAIIAIASFLLLRALPGFNFPLFLLGTLQALLGLEVLALAALVLILFLLTGFVFCPANIHKWLNKNIFKKLALFLKWLIPGENDFLERYENFILHAYEINSSEAKTKAQGTVFKELQSYYPEDTKFIVLSMDMDYMTNCHKGIAESNFYDQLKELKELAVITKKKENNTEENLLFPFIHSDPRRLSLDPDFFPRLEEYITSGNFKGFKIYPALGYFPFDIRLKTVYDLAIKYDLPITTHCSMGPVFYRGKLKTLRKEGFYQDKSFTHPFTGNKLEGKNPRSFSPHFTHPLNYYFLMNCPERLYEYWKKCESDKLFNLSHLPIGDYTVDDIKKYRELKICLGHFGGSEEWRRYLDNAWQPNERLELKNPDSFKRMIHDKNGMWKLAPEKSKNIRSIKPLNWFSIISEMLKENDFPKLYADISYNLSDQKMMPLLKVRLETDAQLRKKVLFGTDFYMVSMAMTERRATINLRSYIGEENFQQIAVVNPKKFLS